MKETENPWSEFECWGGKSWFAPSEPRSEEVKDAPKNHYPDSDFDSPDIVKGEKHGKHPITCCCAGCK